MGARQRSAGSQRRWRAPARVAVSGSSQPDSPHEASSWGSRIQGTAISENTTMGRPSGASRVNQVGSYLKPRRSKDPRELASRVNQVGSYLKPRRSEDPRELASRVNEVGSYLKPPTQTAAPMGARQRSAGRQRRWRAPARVWRQW